MIGCGVVIGYGLESSLAAISQQYRVLPPTRAWSPSREVRPRSEAPIIIASSQSGLFGEYQCELYRYGLVPQSFASPDEADRYKKWLVRGEQVHYQRNNHNLSRCLVPISHFITEEFDGERFGKRYWQRKQQPLFSVAGVYTQWQKPTKAVVKSFAVLTVPRNTATPGVDRTPVIIHERDWGAWLNPKRSFRGLGDLLEPMDERYLEAVGQGVGGLVGV